MKILLIIYDNGSHIHWFPQGMGYIAAVLRKAGHEVTIYSQDLHHYPEEHLTRFLDQNRFDAAGVSVIAGYYQYRKLLSIAEAVNRSKHRPFFIIGGHGPSPQPEFYIRKTKADAIVIGEGEITILELLQALTDRSALAGIPGIAYTDGPQVRVNPRRPLITDIDSIPFPAYNLFPIDYYRLLRFVHMTPADFVMPVLSGRGCPFTCSFCYRLDPGFRPRGNESLIEEIRLLNRDYGINYIYFTDELLMSSETRVTALCEDFIKAGLKFKWSCNGRLNYAAPAVLNIMKTAGCVFINYGIEAFNDQVLKNMNKALTTRQVEQGIAATLQAGISPGLNIIFGNIGDTLATLNQGVEFLLKYDDGAQMRTIRPVTPYPGSPLYDTAVARGLIKDCEDFYENKHLNSDLLSVNFTDLSDDEFHAALYAANQKLIRNYFDKKSAQTIGEAEDLYLRRNAQFRGFRQS